MTQDEATALVNGAINLVVKYDAILLDLNVAERAVSFRLAHYMLRARVIRPPLTVDCEYNRHFDKPKLLRLPRRDATDREVHAITVFPDILVHERNSEANNLIVLEVKKPGVDTNYDLCKLLAFRQELRYVHAGHVILGRASSGKLVREIEWVNG